MRPCILSLSTSDPGTNVLLRLTSDPGTNVLLRCNLSFSEAITPWSNFLSRCTACTFRGARTPHLPPPPQPSSSPTQPSSVAHASMSALMPTPSFALCHFCLSWPPAATLNFVIVDNVVVIDNCLVSHKEGRSFDQSVRDNNSS